jgi:mevalonyl-CoA ligase
MLKSNTDKSLGGENIFPLEIEERLMLHPAISEGSVVAIKDQRYGEVVGAFLRRIPGASLGPEEVVQWTRQALGSHKSPTYVFFAGDEGVGDELPKTGSGKYQKHIMRAIGDKLVSQGYPAMKSRARL